MWIYIYIYIYIWSYCISIWVEISSYPGWNFSYNCKFTNNCKDSVYRDEISIRDENLHIINPFFISKKSRNMKNNFYFFNNYIFVHMFQWTSSKYFFFNFRFSSRKSQSLQKLAEKVTYFTIQFCSKTSLISRTSTHSTLKKKISSQYIHSQEPFSLYKFSRRHLVGVRENICTAQFLDVQELHSQSTLKANVCVFLYIFVRTFLFQRRSKLLSGGTGLKAARCFGLVKCFTIIHFNWNFWKFNFFSASRYFHL